MGLRRTLILALIVFVGAASPVAAKTWPVNEYVAIQQAIESAAYGDTVLVAPGKYKRLVIRSGITLLSESGPEDTILRFNSIWVIKGDGVDSLATIEGFTIDGVAGAEGVILAENSQFTVRNCVIKGGWSGIRQLYSDLTIEDCVIRDCQNGLYLFESAGVISNTDVQLCVTGMNLVSASPRILRCTVSRNTLGLRIAEHSEPTLGGTLATANRVWNNAAGAIKNEAFARRNGIRTNNPATIHVPFNYWGSDCPEERWFRGAVEWSPWIDEAGAKSLEKCPPGSAKPESSGGK